MTDLAERFSKDIESAKRDAELESQRNQQVQSQQASLWNSLKSVAKEQVDEINSGGGILTFATNDPDHPEGFKIIYNREAEKRTASATFRESAHVVGVEITSKDVVPREYKIAAKNGRVRFLLGEHTETTPEEMATYMLNCLL